MWKIILLPNSHFTVVAPDGKEITGGDYEHPRFFYWHNTPYMATTEYFDHVGVNELIYNPSVIVDHTMS